MMSASIHPAARLSLWLLVLLLVQRLSGGLLVGAVPLVLLALFFASGRRALQRGRRLVWRARWLLLTLVLIFAWGVPGESVWDGGGAIFSPTHEGVREGIEHLARLLLTLLLVAGLLESMPSEQLLAAIHLFLGPLRCARVDTERGLVRLMLVLRQLEAPPVADWRSLLRDGGEGAVSPEHLEIVVPPLCLADRALILGAVLMLPVTFWLA